MIKQFFVALFAVLSLIAVPAHGALAQTTVNENTTGNRTSDPIWSGLWSGVNLDIRGFFSGKQSDTAAQTTPPPVRTEIARPQANQTNQPPRQQEPATQTSPRPAPITTGRYVALGDSVAAGTGLPSKPNPSDRDTRCGRSAQSYPYEVARQLQMPWHHLACGGATAGDLFTQQRPGGANVPAQIGSAFSNGTPSIMTITAGANDVDWSNFIRRCYIYQCDRPSFKALADARLALLQGKLHVAFQDIQRRSGSGPTPTVIATGYYKPLSEQCTAIQSEITASEIRWISERVSDLNATIEQVSNNYSFVRFVPVNFAGHDICSSKPWVQGLNDGDPFHPNTEGHKVIARTVLQSLGR